MNNLISDRAASGKTTDPLLNRQLGIPKVQGMNLHRLFLVALTSCLFACGEAPTVEDAPAALEVPEADLGWANMKFTYEDQPFTGCAVSHHKDGSIAKRFALSNGVYDGLAEEWYEDGTKKVETNFRAGKRHGDSMYWDEDGKVFKRQLWEDDVLIRDEKE